jgi:DNA-binding NarL/FixJ family response regulator
LHIRDVATRNLFIADDHPVITDSLQAFFTDHFHQVSVYSNGQELKDAIENNAPSHLILDINLPLLSGVEILSWIQTERMPIKSVIFSMYNSNALVLKCQQLGAAGYVLKTASNQEVLQGFEANKFFIGSGIKLEKEETCLENILTAREEEVLKLLVKDYGSKQIAEILFVSEFTITTHRRNLKRKLGVETTSGLIKYAFENGLVRL